MVEEWRKSDRYLYFTFAWMGVLAIATLCAWSHSRYGVPTLSFSLYDFVRTVGAFAMLILGFWTLHLARIAAKSENERWITDARLRAMVLFWALFPPLWFFTEYNCADRELIKLPPDFSKKDFLSQLKDYGGYAEKIWAAFGALIAITLSQAKKPTSK